MNQEHIYWNHIRVWPTGSSTPRCLKREDTFGPGVDV